MDPFLAENFGKFLYLLTYFQKKKKSQPKTKIWVGWASKTDLFSVALPLIFTQDSFNFYARM